MIIFLTGISGLLGTNLAHLLLEHGATVKGLVRNKHSYKGRLHPQLQLIEESLFSDVIHHLQNVDVVIHTAAMTQQNVWQYSAYHTVNHDATVHLLQAAIDAGVKKFIYVSSANTIGYGIVTNTLAEAHPMRYPFTKSYYALSKYAAEQAVLAQKEKLTVHIINPGFMLGAYDSKPSSGKILLMSLGKRVVFYPPGGKSFVHVMDVAEAIWQSIQHGTNGSRYLITGDNMSYQAFFRLLKQMTGQKQQLLPLPKLLLYIIGYTGDLLRLLHINNSWHSNNMRILAINNFYKNDHTANLLQIKRRDITEAIEDAISYFNNQ